MRFLFSGYPLYGHLLPLLPLARAAQRAGHEVVIATGGDLVSQVEQYGFVAWRVEAIGYRRPAAAPWIPGPSADVAARLRAPELMARAQTWVPDVVVHDPIELAAPIVAARVGARHFVHSLGPMVPAGVYAYLVPQLERLYGEWGLPELAGSLPQIPYLDICPRSLQPDGPAVWKRVIPLRPIPIEGKSGESLTAAVNSLPHRHTIHVTMGTVVNKAPAVFGTVVAGLRDHEVNLVVTVGPDVDPSSLGPQPSHIIVERFMPHGLLLPHCQLVVNHAGNGSVLAALSHGLPLLLLPQAADQFCTAAACARAGAGLVLRPGELTPEAVSRAVTRLLMEPSFTSCARRIQAEIAAMPAPEHVVRRLEKHVPEHTFE